MDQQPSDEQCIRPGRPPQTPTGFTAEKPPPPPGKGVARLALWRRVLVGVFISLWLSLLTGCGSLCFFAYTCFSPTDRVQLTVSNIPSGVDRVCVASESGGATRVMHLYLTDVFPFVSKHPYIGLRSRLSSIASADVAWIPGERYAVFTRRTDGKWYVTRFAAEDVPLQERSTVLGGGNATFDLSKEQAEMLAADKANELGLSTLQDP